MAIATQPLIVTPAHPLFAAEVSGVDLTRPLDDATFGRIAQAFDEYSVLRLPRRRRSTDETADGLQRALRPARDHRAHPGEEDRLGAHMVDPRTWTRTASSWPGATGGCSTSRGNQLWHTDSSFKPVPAHSSALSGRVVPPEGGDTEFVSMRVAYDALPEDLRRRSTAGSSCTASASRAA